MSTTETVTVETETATQPIVEQAVSAESEGGSAVSGKIAPPPGQLKKADFVSDQEVRWCPGLRRLRHSQQRAEGDARARHPAREDRFRFRHRLFVALSLLHEHLWLSQHSRTRARSRHRHQVRESRS